MPFLDGSHIDKNLFVAPSAVVILTLQILLFTSQQYFIIYQIQVILRIFISYSFNLIDFLFHHD